MTTAEILISRAKNYVGWCFIVVYGEVWIYHDGEYIKNEECVFVASMYRDDIKQLYLYP